jgi:hypothetical protein
MKVRLLYLFLLQFFILLSNCTNTESDTPVSLPDSEAAFTYLKGLEGKWLVQGGEEREFAWEFDITSREGVILERLKVGTPTEMATVYNLDDGILRANHYCKFRNRR